MTDKDDWTKVEAAAERLAKGDTGEQVKTLFGSRKVMADAMLAMAATYATYKKTITDCCMLDEAEVDGVILGMTINFVLIQRILKQNSMQTLANVSKAIELCELIEAGAEDEGVSDIIHPSRRRR